MPSPQIENLTQVFDTLPTVPQRRSSALGTRPVIGPLARRVVGTAPIPRELRVTRIPIVDYLVLEPEPHLRAHECTDCGARFFGRRNACASCGGQSFTDADVATEGEVVAFTIVSFAAPGIDVPFVAAVLDCDGTTVQANLTDVTPDPDHVHLGMRVRLTTYSMGPDAEGVEGIGFAFAPLPGAGTSDRSAA